MMIGEFANSVITFAKELESRALLMSNGDEKDVLYRTVLATTKAIIGYCEILRDEVPSAHPKHFRDLTKKVDVISRQATIEALDVGAEVLRRVLDEADVVGVERAKYEWGLGLIESYISDMKELPSAQPSQDKYEYHYDHTDCIWYRPEARNRCPVTCAQYRDGWNDAMNYIFRNGNGYRPYRRDQQYGE